MKIVGIDVGKKGFAVISDSKTKTIDILKFTFDESNNLGINPFKKYLAYYQPDLVVIEKIHGRGGWGATQNFNFGFLLGQLLTIIREQFLSFTYISPVKWQNLVAKGIGKSNVRGKERTLIAYRNLFPSNPLPEKNQKIDDNLLDAFMISIAGHLENGSLDNYNFILNREFKHD
jgi:hypothetical protein